MIAALIVAVIAVVLLAKSCGDDDDGGSETAAPVGLSESELIDRAADFDHIAYWVGPLPDTDTYELTDTPDGRIYVRYLTGGAETGVDAPDYLTVGTYAVPAAAQALETAAAESGGKVAHQAAFDALEQPGKQGVYVVFKDQPDLQIEVFAPDPGVANGFVSAGKLQPLS